MYYFSLQEDHDSSFLFQETILQAICLVNASLPFFLFARNASLLLTIITLLISGEFIIIQAC